MGTLQATHDLLEQAEQDAIIAKRLPGWMRPGNPEHIRVLCRIEGQPWTADTACRPCCSRLYQSTASPRPC